MIRQPTIAEFTEPVYLTQLRVTGSLLNLSIPLYQSAVLRFNVSSLISSYVCRQIYLLFI